jgi:hypothetical protein
MHSHSRAEAMKAEIRDHIRAMEGVVKTTLYPDELYERFLSHLTAATAAHGAAIWRLEASGEAILAASAGVSDELARDAWVEHGQLVAVILNASEQAIVEPADPANPTALTLLFQRVHQRSPLAVELVPATARPESLRGYSAFLHQLAAILAQARCIPWE